MILACLLVLAAYLFYKWATSNNDFFKKKRIPFVKPVFLLGSSAHMFIKKSSLPDLVQKLYDDFKDEK